MNHVKAVAKQIQSLGMEAVIYKGLTKKSLFEKRISRFKHARWTVEIARAKRSNAGKISLVDLKRVAKMVKAQTKKYTDVMYLNHNARAIESWQKDARTYIFDAKYDRGNREHARLAAAARRAGKASDSPFYRLERFMLSHPGRHSTQWRPSVNDGRGVGNRGARK